MLTRKQKITTPLLSIIILSTFSGITSYYTQFIFIEPLSRRTFSSSFFLVSCVFIILVYVIHLLIINQLFKGRTINLFKRGILCFVLDIALLLLITLPTLGIDWEAFLAHITGVSLFSAFIPSVSKLFEKLI